MPPAVVAAGARGPADVRRGDAAAGRRPGALRGGAAGHRRRRDRGAGARRGGRGRGRARRAAGRLRRRARAGAGGAPDLARGARQRRARLDRWRRSRGGRGIRARRARRARAAARHAAGAVGAGAARGHRPVGCGKRALHADRRHAGRGGGAPAARGVRLQGAAGAAPRAHLRRGRRLRHEDPALRRVRGAALCGPAPGPAGEVVRDAGWRASSPTPPAATACSRASWRWTPPGKILAPSRPHARRHRRLRLDVLRDLRHQQHEELPVQRLRDPGHPDRRQDGAHQRRAARARTAGPAGRRRST